ncbi:adenine phosphoribosyltransferase [Luteimonas yindakuii]|uniref:Adenine phosphoribosyltransferase n=1 Tax=Luteimonas yindakuii TaxID=2565782 RepID=A0A4Z1RFR6_9GAMM|nr:adenine phosphoribosyltransferase [Luteimonas yindakuii]TKS52929.1 adenine phosphoribosyltransferase [Luteimonas yindakuii]
MHDWHHLIREVADFPRPGIRFSDITPLLADARGLAAAIDAMAAPWRATRIDAVAGVESRGFIIGSALALSLGTGFVPIRKPGKLPARTLHEEYALEYGRDRLEIHADALSAGQRVLLVDDVLATGGTLVASVRLLRRLDVELVGVGVLVELDALHARTRWPHPDITLESALRY